MNEFLNIAREIEKNANLISNPSINKLRELAKKDERTTEFGSASYISQIKNRSAAFTEIIEKEPNLEQIKIIEDVRDYLKNKEMILVERTLCQSQDFNLKCKLIITKDYARIPYMWNKSLFSQIDGKKEDMIVIDVPEWKQRKVLVDAVNYVTFILGSDYFGECKKANLRMAMHIIKSKGGLGLHAGSKLLRLKDKYGKLHDTGFLLFGLSGTGKTTLTVHDHNLKGEERVIIRQDDVVLMTKEGYCYGTEDGFYIKTEGLTTDQTVLYNAATKPSAVLENIHVDNDGKVDFLNYELTSNGRGIILRKEIPQTDSSIDLEKAKIIIFITRRDDIIPPISKLNAEQAAAAFMLGESIETSAGDPSKAGQSKRVVGTNPFIIGPLHEEGHRFLEIIRANPDIECYIMNTGHVGGKDNGDKITIRDSTIIMEHLARGDISWKESPEWNYQIPEEIKGIDSKKLNPANYYPEEKYNLLCQALRDERIAYFKKFPELAIEIVISLLEPLP